MVRYNLDEVSDEMVLGENIFSPNGDLLLAAGFRLSEPFRKRLRQLGFIHVYIQVFGTEDVVPEQVVSEHIQREIASAVNKGTTDLRHAFNVRMESSTHIRKMIRQNRQHLNKFLSSGNFLGAVEKMIDEILSNPTVMLNMETLKNAGQELFSHALNVTVISMAIGRKYRFSYEEMKQLALGAINADIGLIAVPEDVRKSAPDAMDDYGRELYKNHTLYGYLMLSQNHTITPTSAAVALQHHEHQDGSGYPRGIKGENRPPMKDLMRKGVIHRFAEIVAVADTFDTLCSGRNGNAGIDVREAMKRLIELSGQVLNSDIVKTLASIVPTFPTGARFRIVEAPSSQLIGYFGVVAKTNEENLECPQIILYESKNRQKIKPIFIDLALHSGFQLEVVL